jgi:hypothetical protein
MDRMESRMVLARALVGRSRVTLADGCELRTVEGDNRGNVTALRDGPPLVVRGDSLLPVFVEHCIAYYRWPGLPLGAILTARQARICSAYADASGFDIIDAVTDHGIGGAMTRPTLRRTLERAARSGLGVLASNVSRLATPSEGEPATVAQALATRYGADLGCAASGRWYAPPAEPSPDPSPQSGERWRAWRPGEDSGERSEGEPLQLGRQEGEPGQAARGE